jgi:hypothetical protein
VHMKPHRVQLSRAKGWRMPANSVKVDRTTLFGNPFSIADYGHDSAVALHRAWITGQAINASFSPEAMKDLMARRNQVAACSSEPAWQAPCLLVCAAKERRARQLPRCNPAGIGQPLSLVSSPRHFAWSDSRYCER